MTTDNIFPNRDSFVSRKEKENRINQKGIVIWLTGLSGSGKSTLALELEKLLVRKGFLTEVLDGDKIRNGLNSDLGFSAEDRLENIRRIAEVAKLFCNAGIITIAAFISPTVKIRQIAKKIVGKKDYLEIYISTPLFICEERDTKGLYKKARKGLIKDFTGISSPYETPQNPDISIDTSNKTVAVCINEIYNTIFERIRSKN